MSIRQLYCVFIVAIITTNIFTVRLSATEIKEIDIYDFAWGKVLTSPGTLFSYCEFILTGKMNDFIEMSVKYVPKYEIRENKLIDKFNNIFDSHKILRTNPKDSVPFYMRNKDYYLIRAVVVFCMNNGSRKILCLGTESKGVVKAKWLLSEDDNIPCELLASIVLLLPLKDYNVGFSLSETECQREQEFLKTNTEKEYLSKLVYVDSIVVYFQEDYKTLSLSFPGGELPNGVNKYNYPGSHSFFLDDTSPCFPENENIDVPGTVMANVLIVFERKGRKHYLVSDLHGKSYYLGAPDFKINKLFLRKLDEYLPFFYRYQNKTPLAFFNLRNSKFNGRVPEINKISEKDTNSKK